MEASSLTFTILSFVVAFISLIKMWRIEQNTSSFNEKRAKKEDKSNERRDEKLDNIIQTILNINREDNPKNQKTIIEENQNEETQK